MKKSDKNKCCDRPDKLLYRLKNGEPDALKQLYDLHYFSLLSYCNRLLADHFQAEEIVMDSFLKLWSHRTEFQTLSGIVHYMFAVSKNACVDQLRKRKKSKIHQEFPIDISDTDTARQEAELIRTQLYQLAILQAEDFPPKMKHAFMMIFRDGFSLQETADSMGVSIHTVKTHRQFALKVLRQSLPKNAFGLFLFLFF